MSQTTVTIKRSGPFVKVYVDNVEVAFNPAEIGKVDVEAGLHQLVWTAIGPPLQKYKVEITAPKANEWEHADTIDDDRKDGGLHWFKTA